MVAAKASQPVLDGVPIQLDSTAPAWVSRAAEKLVAALAAFVPQGLTVAGRTAVDAGASTGGFTQVLLHSGARSVVALDVGHGQLAATVAADPRVTERSGCTVRGLRPEDLGGPVDLLVADLSFISLTLVLADLTGLVHPGGDLVVLVKPQFEVGRTRLGKSGVVRRPADRRHALRAVAAAAAAAGASVRGIRTSPIRGGEGNTEYLMWLTRADGVGLAWEALSETIHRLSEGEPT